MCKEYQARICSIESDKYDTEKEVEYKDYMVSYLNVWKDHRHLRNEDCSTARTACLVCFISTVNSSSKKRNKRSLLQAALVTGTQQNLSSLYYLDVYVKNQIRMIF